MMVRLSHSLGIDAAAIRSPAPPNNGQLTDSWAQPSVLLASGAAENDRGGPLPGWVWIDDDENGRTTIRPSVNRPEAKPLK